MSAIYRFIDHIIIEVKDIDHRSNTPIPGESDQAREHRLEVLRQKKDQWFNTLIFFYETVVKETGTVNENNYIINYMRELNPEYIDKYLT